jgi:hypothetical protein
MNVCCCNRDFNFIIVTNYVTKTSNYTSHMYLLMKIGVQNIQGNYSKTTSKDQI